MAQDHILIIGGGLGGLLAAIKVQEAGYRFTLIEKSPKVGGTWYDNAYPGCACDVPVALYQFSFAPSMLWSRQFPAAHEVQAYAEELVARYQLAPHIKLGTHVETADWDGDKHLWRLVLEDGKPLEGFALIGALGQLNRPQFPDIPGQEAFAGEAMHTARWLRGSSFKNKQVGVIGTAASAVQVIPELAKTAAHLTIFQRSPNWIVPRNDAPITEEDKALTLSQLPAAARIGELNRQLIFETADQLTWHAFSWTPEARAAFTRRAHMHMAGTIEDPALRTKLTPDYPIGCRRVLFCDDYYPALLQDHVTLETTPIAEIVPGGVRTQDDQLHNIDFLVYATGFNTTDWRWSVEVTGEAGDTLNTLWADGPEAYCGITVAGFPNFFMLYGPNTNLGHNSITYMMEAQMDHILGALSALKDKGAAAMAPSLAAQHNFNKQLQTELSRTVWADPQCTSWYKTKDGRITQNWSQNARAYRDHVETVVIEDYVFTP